MVSINTNLSSMLVQMNLSKSTFDLNKAIERMTTGYKLNHASDNAANYSIAQDMVSKLSSYDVATDNISMGNDLLKTAQDSISLMQSHGERIHNLVTQAMNGTYGEQSQSAIVSEINARIAEVDRLYQTTEYNGVSLFNNQKIEIPEDSTLKPGDGGFIDESALSGPVMVEETGFIRALSTGTVDGIKDSYTDAEISAMTKVKTLDKFTSGKTYAVTDVEDLQKLAELQNSGKSTSGVTFVLGADLDLSGIDWNPIGDNSSASNATRFRGTFNGNGHTISNLTVDNPNSDYQGLFGFVNGGKIRNLGLKDAEVSGNKACGALAGYITNSSSQIDNCYTTSTVNGQGSYVGGLIGQTHGSTVKNCYSVSDVSGQANYVGGLIGACTGSSIENCYSNSVVISQGTYIGGFAGSINNGSSVINSFSTGSVSGKNYVGGFAANCSNSSVSNCYTTSSVSGDKYVGGFFGLFFNNSSISDSYSAGTVYAKNYAGGFIGRIGANGYVDSVAEINNCTSYSDIYADGSEVGSFIGLHVMKTIYAEDYSEEHGDSYEYTCDLTVSGCKSLGLNMNMVGGFGNKNYTEGGSNTDFTIVSREQDYLPFEIESYDLPSTSTSIQVGINGDSSSSISFDTNFRYDLSTIAVNNQVSASAYNVINQFLNNLSAKATTLGAATNRLDSALESTTVAMENLTSSLSTIRDADIATESSNYIKAQILQQASATLLATANQSPSIALQLL